MINFLRLNQPLNKLLTYASYLLWAIIALSLFTQQLRIWQLFAVNTGGYALVTLWFVMLPGILKRFQVKGPLQKIQILLMALRRRLGILVFTFATAHYLWNRLFLYLKIGPPNLSQIPLYEKAGLAAFLLLLPLFATSNNPAENFLKQNWQRLHYLIYPAIWATALHVTLMGGRLVKFALPTLILATIQIASRAYNWRQKSLLKNKIPVPSSNQTSPSKNPQSPTSPSPSPPASSPPTPDS